MKAEESGGRALKKQIFELLRQDAEDARLEAISHFPARKAINPLFSFFYNTDPVIRWRAVVAMGKVVADHAEEDIESARVVMRRLMWSLNEESGGIGWGSPEAMGEIMARSEILAGEYHQILISYIREGGSYLENPELQKGVLWGLGRLAHRRPMYVAAGIDALTVFLDSDNPYLRGLAAWTVHAVDPNSPSLDSLANDAARITIFMNDRFVEGSINRLIGKETEK